MAQDADRKKQILYLTGQGFAFPQKDQIRLINKFFFPSMRRSRKSKVNARSKLIEIILK